MQFFSVDKCQNQHTIFVQTTSHFDGNYNHNRLTKLAKPCVIGDSFAQLTLCAVAIVRLRFIFIKLIESIRCLSTTGCCHTSPHPLLTWHESSATSISVTVTGWSFLTNITGRSVQKAVKA